MTTQLKDLLRTEADELGTVTVDVDRIIATGEHRLRRRRSLIGAIAACLAIIATLAASELMRGDDRAVDPVTPGPLTITYAIGSEVHQGDQTYDVGRPITFFVTTADGIVFSDDDDVVWSKNGDDAVERVGRTTTFVLQPFTVDPTGRLVAWFEPTPELVVFEPSSGSQWKIPVESLPGVVSYGVTAIDGDEVHFSDARGGHVFRTGTGEVADQALTGVIDIAGGVQLGIQFDTLVAEGPEGRVVMPAHGADRMGTALSPDGGHAVSIVIEPDDEFRMGIFDTRSGQVAYPRRPPVQPGETHQWLDATTLAVYLVTQHGGINTVDVVTCQVGAAACRIAAKQEIHDDELGSSHFPGEML